MIPQISHFLLSFYWLSSSVALFGPFYWTELTFLHLMFIISSADLFLIGWVRRTSSGMIPVYVLGPTVLINQQ